MEDHDHNPPNNPPNNPTKNETPQKGLYILTYNVKTLSSYERLIELNEAFREIKYDVLGLAETSIGNKIEEHENFIFCYTGHTPGRHGIGFIVKHYLKNNIESYLGISERVGILNLKFEHNS